MLVSSAAAIIPAPTRSLYCASKAASLILYQSLAIEHPKISGHTQSLILGGVLFNAAMLLGALGVIGDLLAAQRTISQRTFERIRRIELQLEIEPSHYEPGAEPVRTP